MCGSEGRAVIVLVEQNDSKLFLNKALLLWVSFSLPNFYMLKLATRFKDTLSDGQDGHQLMIKHKEGIPAINFEVYSLVLNEDRGGEKVEEDQFSSLRGGRTII